MRNIVQAHYHWQIWREHNNKIFEQKESKARIILRLICIRDRENIRDNTFRIKNVNLLLTRLDTI